MTPAKRAKKSKFWGKIRERSGVFMLGTILFIAFGVTAFLIGGSLSGWDIIGWFSTQTAYFVYAFAIVFLLILAVIWYVMKKKELTNDD